MENQEENTEPPGPRTRRACRAIEAAKKVEERRILEELPHVMLVRLNEEVRQQAMDKVHDQGRRPNDAILRGESAGGNFSIKKEVVEDEEEGVDEGRQEIDALQQGDEVEVGDEDVSIKEEVSEGEEMLEANPVGNHMLSDGQTVAIPIELLQEMEVKEEEQDEEGHLVTSGDEGEGEGEGTEQEPILLDDEAFVADEVGGDKSLVEEDQAQVAGVGKVNLGSREESRQDETLNFEEVGSSGQGGETRMELVEDIADGEGEVDEEVGEQLLHLLSFLIFCTFGSFFLVIFIYFKTC